MVMREIRQQHLHITKVLCCITGGEATIFCLVKIRCIKCTHFQAMQRVRFGKHFELGQLADKPHRLVLGLNVNLVLLSYL